MSRDERMFAEAVASLAARLDGWGVPEAHDKAHDFLRDMTRHGWRPSSARYEEPMHKPGRTPPPADVLADARAALAAVLGELCSHGVPFTHCRQDHDPNTTEE